MTHHGNAAIKFLLIGVHQAEALLDNGSMTCDSEGSNFLVVNLYQSVHTQTFSRVFLLSQNE